MSSRINVTLTTPGLKDKAQNVYNNMGMSLSTAINIFLKQSVRENKMPFLPSNEANHATVPLTSDRDLRKIINEIEHGYKGERHHLIE